MRLRLHGGEGLVCPALRDGALQAGVVVDGQAVYRGRPKRGGVHLVLPNYVGGDREPEAVASGHILVHLIHPGLGLGDQVARAGRGIRAHCGAEQSRHFSRRKVGWESPAGERGAVVREREAVGAGTEARIGDNADPPW